MTTRDTADSPGDAFGKVVFEQVEAALSYFLKLEKHLEIIIASVASASGSSARIGRGFLKISMSVGELDKEFGHQRIDLASRIGAGRIVANKSPGELVVAISYDDNRRSKDIVWLFPRKEPLTPEQMAQFIVRSLTAPTDFTPE